MSTNKPPLVIIGYGGHSYVVIESAKSAGLDARAYFDFEIKAHNPYKLAYFGNTPEHETHEHLFSQNAWFVAIGNNTTRSKVQDTLSSTHKTPPITIRHAKSILAESVKLADGVLIAAGAILQPLVTIGKGAICNTGCIVEHECIVSDFVHIGPGAVLSGDVQVGKNTFIGANSVVKQGIRIGKNCIVGAGAVVLRDIPDDTTVVGNPARPLTKPK